MSSAHLLPGMATHHPFILYQREKRPDVTNFLHTIFGAMAGADQAAATLDNTDGEIGGLTISDPPTQAEVQALRDRCEELADDVRALSGLVHALREALVAVGVVKGGESLASSAQLTWGQDNPEPEAVVPVRPGGRCRGTRTGSPWDRSTNVPDAAADHAVRAHSARNRGPLRVECNPTSIVAKPVLTPLPHIPVHVMQPPRIRQLLPHRMRLAVAVVPIPSVVRQVRVARVIPIAEPRRRPPPTRILPLRLRRQPINTRWARSAQPPVRAPSAPHSKR